MLERRRIGVFAGTFDPFTVAHREIVRKVLADGLVDEVRIVPSTIEWHRTGKPVWLGRRDRLKVIRTMVRDLPKDRVVLDTREYLLEAGLEERLRPAFRRNRGFVNTLIDIAAARPGDDLYVILGGDSYSMMRQWPGWADIASLAKVILVDGRDGAGVVEYSGIPVAARVTIDGGFCDVSATKVREGYAGLGVDAYLASVEYGTPGDEVLVRTPIFDVVRRGEVAPGFRPVGVVSRDWVTVVADLGGKYLCTKQLRYGLMREMTEFPCGMVEVGEEPEAAARRELEEETGIRVEDGLERLGSFAANPGFMTNTMHYFYVHLLSARTRRVDRRLDEHERIDIEWVPMEDFAGRLEGEGGSSLMAAALHLLEQRRQSRHV